MASDTEIANMSLAFIGSGKELASLTTDTSREAKACRRFFDTTRDEVLRDFGWPFATKIVELALIEEDPTSEWKFSYQYPSDCVMFRRIPSGNRIDSRQTKVPYRIIQSATGKIILTDKSDAEAEYTVRADAVEHYPADFKVAMALKLGTYIAPGLTAGDPFNIINKLIGWYGQQITKAMANSRNEESEDQLPESEFVRARDGAYSDDLSPWRPLPPATS